MVEGDWRDEERGKEKEEREWELVEEEKWWSKEAGGGWRESSSPRPVILANNVGTKE